MVARGGPLVWFQIPWCHQILCGFVIYTSNLFTQPTHVNFYKLNIFVFGLLFFFFLIFTVVSSKSKVNMVPNLVSSFPSGEIKATVWDCGGEKSSGPNGFNFNFIKKFWSFFAVDLKTVLDYYHAGDI